jgi:hypothetical protein
MSRSCDFCKGMKLSDAELDFSCAVCGRRMLLVGMDGLENVYHCPKHCSTLAPSPVMLAAARAGRN